MIKMFKKPCISEQVLFKKAMDSEYKKGDEKSLSSGTRLIAMAIAQKCKEKAEAKMKKEGIKPAPGPLTPELLQAKLLGIMRRAHVKDKTQALEILRQEEPNLFEDHRTIDEVVEDKKQEMNAQLEEAKEMGAEVVEDEEMEDEEVVGKIAEIVRWRTQSSPHNARVAVQKAIANGTVLSLLGADGLSQLVKSSDKSFEQKAAEIRKSRNCSHMDAFELARKEHPAEFRAYQKTGGFVVSKSSTRKAADPTGFEKAVNEIYKRDNCSRREALEKARKEHPEAFKAWNGMGV